MPHTILVTCSVALAITLMLVFAPISLSRLDDVRSGRQKRLRMQKTSRLPVTHAVQGVSRPVR